MIYYCPSCSTYYKDDEITHEIDVEENVFPFTLSWHTRTSTRYGNFCESCEYEVTEVDDEEVDDYISEGLQTVVDDIFNHFDKSITKKEICESIERLANDI